MWDRRFRLSITGRRPEASPRTRHNQRGFTLLEVLVATVIMAVAVIALISNVTTSMRTAARLTDHDRAAMLARQKMDELLSERALPHNVPIQGTWPTTMAQGLDAGWRARITPLEAPPGTGVGSWILERIELQVWWKNGDNERNFTLETYRRGTLTQEDQKAGVLQPVAPAQ